MYQDRSGPDGMMSAMSGTTLQSPPTVDDRREGRAVGWLTFGLLILPIGLAVGWYHVLTASRWSWHDKIVAALLPGPVLSIVLLLRADFDAATCGTAGASSSICLAQPAAGIVKAAAVLGLVGVLAWMTIHLRRTAGAQREFAVVDRLFALVVAVIAAYGVPTLLEPRIDSWSQPEKNAVLDIAASAEAAEEGYAVIDEATASEWISGERPSEQRIMQIAGPGNLRFDQFFDDVLQDRIGDPGEARVTAADLGTCYVFPFVRESAEKRIEAAVGLARFCFGPSERTSAVELDRGD